MQLSLQPFIYASAALFTCALSLLVYNQYYEQAEIRALITALHVQKTSTPALINNPTNQHIQTGSTMQRWSDLQPLVKDTVVQIFSQVTEFNWLEPYKTPNQGGCTGSGFFINDQGDIITNWHVVNQAVAVSIQIPSMGKQRFDVDVIGVNPDRDLALLRLKPEEKELIIAKLGKISFLTFGDSDRVTRSDEIMTLGYPLGQQALKSTTGAVSGREQIEGHYMIQISAPINPGNSGGPSINQAAQVIGINTAGYAAAAAQNVNYIIPSNEVKLFLQQLEQVPEITSNCGDIKFLRKPFLGVLFNNATEALTKFLGNPLPGGLYVVESYKNSPLHKAGILPGDMIYSIDGHRLDIYGEMNVPWSEDKISIVDYVSRLILGSNLHLKVYRKGKALEMHFDFNTSELPAVRRMFPCYEPIEYEIFGGMVIMQLSLNHVQVLLPAAPELARYAELKNQMEPTVVITHILPDSVTFRSRAVGIGSVLTEINGTKVKTLADVRAAIPASLKSGFTTIKTSENVFCVLPFDKILSEEHKFARQYHYTITPAMQSILPRK